MLTVGSHDFVLDFTESRFIFMVYDLAIEPCGAKKTCRMFNTPCFELV